MLVLTGAVFTAALSYWQGEAFLRHLGTQGRFDDVLKILLLLDDAQPQGRALLVQDFRNHINMGYDELGDLLEKLARHGYVYQGRQGWVLKTNAASIELDDLFKLFVYRPAHIQQDYVNDAVEQIMAPCLNAMNITLADFSVHAKSSREEGEGRGAAGDG